MPTHDIIDNRHEKLVDHINQILASTEAPRFAVGYFFLLGLESIAGKLVGVKELRLLIGNTTNRETLEQLAEGYRRSPMRNWWRKWRKDTGIRKTPRRNGWRRRRRRGSGRVCS